MQVLFEGSKRNILYVRKCEPEEILESIVFDIREKLGLDNVPKCMFRFIHNGKFLDGTQCLQELKIKDDSLIRIDLKICKKAKVNCDDCKKN